MSSKGSPQVSSCSTRSLLNTGTYQYIPVRTSTCTYVPVHTGMYWYILIHGFRWTAEELKKIIDMLLRPEFDSAQVDSTYHYQYISLHTSMYWYVPVYTTGSTYKYTPVYTGMYQYVLVYTGTYYYNLHVVPVLRGCCVCRTPLS